MTTGALLATYIIGSVIGLGVLYLVIRAGVRRGIESVIYKQNPDKSWSVHPFVVDAVREVIRKTK